jgi:integrase
VGVRNVGPNAFDAMNRVRPFAESSIIAMKQALSWYLLACCGWPSVRMPGRGKVPDYTAVLALQHRPVVHAFALARQLSVRQRVFRAMAATEEVMHELLSVLVFGVACDLLHASIFTLAYMVALRASDVHALNLENLAFGKHARTNDILVTLPNSKADGAGEGFKRWVQHSRSCPCSSKGFSGRSDGLAWSVASTMGWQFDTSTGDIPVCNACVLLMYLELSGALTHVRAGTGEGVPVFRALNDGRRFSWLMGQEARRRCQVASADDFSEQRLPYEAYNDGLHLVVDRVNELRTARGVATWPRNEAHFHMFRHGHVIMELVFGASLAELMRSARLDPSTVAAYIAHVSTTYAALLHGAEGRSNAAEQSLVVERGQVEDLVQRMLRKLLSTPMGEQTVARLGGSSGRQQMADQVHGLLDALGLSVRGLRSCGERVRQVLVYGCAVRLVGKLDWGLVEPLLAALGGGRAFVPEPPPTVSLPVLVTHVRGLDALGAAGSSGSTSAEADVVHDDEYDSMYDGATVVGAADDGDARTLPPSVDDLEEQWQAMHEQLWLASR